MRFFIYLSLLLPFNAAALEWDGKGDISVAGEYRDFPQAGFGPYAHAYESIVLGKYQMRIFPAKVLRIEGTPEVRGFVSRMVGRGPGEPGYATVEGPERLFDFKVNLATGNTSQWLLDTERLNLILSLGNIEVQLGRKPIGVGTLKVLPIWNKFSRPLPNTAGPNLIFGQDSATLRWQKGQWAFQALDIEGKAARPEAAVRWLEAILYNPALELHLMASRWWEKNVFGLAFAKDLGGATLRGEALDIGPDSHGVENEFQGGLGLEYAVNEVWTFLGESLFQSDGANRTSQYTVLIPSPYRPLRAKAYAFLQATAQIDAYWIASFGALVNGIDGSFYPLLKISRSISDHVDAALDLRGPIGKNGKEFSQQTFHFPQGRTIGAPSQIQLSLTASF
ncbi:MAG: hypothetical protein ACXVBE_15465 [Bdellovibrionota bacterium]